MAKGFGPAVTLARELVRRLDLPLERLLLELSARGSKLTRTLVENVHEALRKAEEAARKTEREFDPAARMAALRTALAEGLQKLADSAKNLASGSSAKEYIKEMTDLVTSLQPQRRNCSGRKVCPMSRDQEPAGDH